MSFGGTGGGEGGGWRGEGGGTNLRGLIDEDVCEVSSRDAREVERAGGTERCHDDLELPQLCHGRDAETIATGSNPGEEQTCIDMYDTSHMCIHAYACPCYVCTCSTAARWGRVLPDGDRRRPA